MQSFYIALSNHAVYTLFAVSFFDGKVHVMNDLSNIYDACVYAHALTSCLMATVD